jgi:hypothetical protein
VIELKRSWIVGLIEAVEKAIRRDSLRVQASLFDNPAHAATFVTRITPVLVETV